MFTKLKENWKVLLLLLLVLLVAGFFAYKSIQEKATEKRLDNEAGKSLSVPSGRSPYTDLEGNPVALTDYLGNILVVNVWASWSPDSASDLSTLASVSGQFANEEVQVLAINRAEPPTSAERYLRQAEVLDGVKLILDPEDNFYSSIGGYAMPETVIYDQDGNIYKHKRGKITEEEILEAIETLR